MLIPLNERVLLLDVVDESLLSSSSSCRNRSRLASTGGGAGCLNCGLGASGSSGLDLDKEKIRSVDEFAAPSSNFCAEAPTPLTMRQIAANVKNRRRERCPETGKHMASQTQLARTAPS